MAAAKKKTAKKTTTAKKSVKRTVAKKTTAKKTVAKKKTAAKKTTTKKTVTKKPAVKKTTAKKAVVKKVAMNALSLKTTPVTDKQTQAQIIADLADATCLEKKAVKNLFDALRNQIQRHMKTRGSGEMTLPGLGIKVRRVSKKATKARKGVNPFTGEPMTIKAKPARKAVRATALKALKDLV